MRDRPDSDSLFPLIRGGAGSVMVLLSAMVSVLLGIIFPITGMSLEPYVLIWLGGLLYVNLINLHPRGFISAFGNPKMLIIFTVGKLILLPGIVYVITLLVYPKLALPATLLSGISTGLGAPFAINFIEAGDIRTIAALVTITSLLVPITLPVIIYLLFEDTEEFVIPIYDMVFLLAAALFIPLSLGWGTRKYVPKVSKFVADNSLFLSVIFIVLINFSVFSRLSEYFFVDQSLILTSFIYASILFIIYLIVGYFLSRTVSKEQVLSDRINGMIAMTYINNILVFVVAERFFDIKMAVLAAFYIIPYFTGLLVLRMKYSQ